MAALQRLAGGVGAMLLALGLTIQPGYAATKPTPAPKPTQAAQPARPVAVRPPLIFQVNPTKVNPTIQPNIMILGQYLTPTSTVHVGSLPATTVEAPDPNHLLVKLPDNLSQGRYPIEVRNEAGTAVASDPLIVDNSGGQPTTMQYLVVGGFLVLLVLVMRLARTPGLA